ncbi:hypothetical protein DPMN_075406 [Dreissena polymorpha]|uniref:Uncharacterized protein n=1 Tax=Dreissena polymorpha TaxID=45954 RepID=A0A9D3YKB0_DREPO|nr:hypothetical protein DPMN_075406 [Dreissena polymorpha]
MKPESQTMVNALKTKSKSSHQHQASKSSIKCTGNVETAGVSCTRRVTIVQPKESSVTNVTSGTILQKSLIQLTLFSDTSIFDS